MAEETKNIILTDFIPNKDWSFPNILSKVTQKNGK